MTMIVIGGTTATTGIRAETAMTTTADTTDIHHTVTTTATRPTATTMATTVRRTATATTGTTMGTTANAETMRIADAGTTDTSIAMGIKGGNIATEVIADDTNQS